MFANYFDIQNRIRHIEEELQYLENKEKGCRKEI